MKKNQIKNLDKLWSERVKKQAGYKCEYCLEELVWLNSCHIIGRANRATRWLLLNGISLCYYHHRQYDTHGPEHEKIRQLVIGEDRIRQLCEIGQVISKNQDYDTIRKELLNGN